MTTTDNSENVKRSTKRRGSGEGSIFQRGDGRWTATITIGYDAKGKRKRRTVYGKTKGEVQKKMLELQQQKQAGTLAEINRMTTGQYLDHWLNNIARPNIRENTHASYDGAIKNHISPRIGGVRLTDLSPVHIERMLSEMERAKVSARMRQLCYAVLRRSLNRAMKGGRLYRNPCLCVDPPRVEQKEVKPLTGEQARLLLKVAAGSRFHALFVLAVTTGMRQGELFGLHWSDIDLERGTLIVRRTLLETRGKLSWGEPKAKQSRRMLSLPPMAVQALWDHKAKMLTEGRAGLEVVFCDSHGGLLRKSNFARNVWKPLLASAELPHFRFHDLRHTHIALLCQAGEHPKVIQARAGHSQISVTMNTYGHLMPGMDAAAADKVGAMLALPAGEGEKSAATA